MDRSFAKWFTSARARAAKFGGTYGLFWEFASRTKADTGKLHAALRLGPNVWCKFVVYALVLGFLPFAGPSVQAENLLLLDETDRTAYQAVGRVNSAGYAHRRGCTGTLIAPDLVLTAAHCVGQLRGATGSRHYIAGWYRGRFTAHRESAEVMVHPLYDLKNGRDRFAYDVAMIRLEDPIPSGLVAPIPLVAEDHVLDGPADLFGYANRRPHALSGARDCPLLATRAGIRYFRCVVHNGTSGGAVLVDGAEGPALAAVIVARSEPEGYAVVVPVSGWVRDAWAEGMRRSNRRP